MSNQMIMSVCRCCCNASYVDRNDGGFVFSAQVGVPMFPVFAASAATHCLVTCGSRRFHKSFGTAASPQPSPATYASRLLFSHHWEAR